MILFLHASRNDRSFELLATQAARSRLYANKRGWFYRLHLKQAALRLRPTHVPRFAIHSLKLPRGPPVWKQTHAPEPEPTAIFVYGTLKRGQVREKCWPRK